MRSVGVVLGVGKKREGNLALSSDSSKFRTMSVLSHWLLNVLHPGNMHRIHFRVSRLFQLCRSCCRYLLIATTSSHPASPVTFQGLLVRKAADYKAEEFVCVKVCKHKGPGGVLEGTRARLLCRCLHRLLKRKPFSICRL